MNERPFTKALMRRLFPANLLDALSGQYAQRGGLHDLLLRGERDPANAVGFLLSQIELTTYMKPSSTKSRTRGPRSWTVFVYFEDNHKSDALELIDEFDRRIKEQPAEAGTRTVSFVLSNQLPAKDASPRGLSHLGMTSFLELPRLTYFLYEKTYGTVAMVSPPGPASAIPQITIRPTDINE